MAPKPGSETKQNANFALLLPWYISCYMMNNPRDQLMLNDFVRSAHMSITYQILQANLPDLNYHLYLKVLHEVFGVECICITAHSSGKSCLASLSYSNCLWTTGMFLTS